MKFAAEDRRYLEARKALWCKYGERELWSIIDHWPLYCGVANLGRAMAITDLLRSTLDVPGPIAEFGSCRQRWPPSPSLPFRSSIATSIFTSRRV